MYASPMHKLLYVSTTKRDFPEPDLQAILAVSRKNNPSLGVTGLLLYIDGGFLQVLEGDREVIRVLYDKIAQDTRHWNAKILLEEQGERNFGQWSMGFKELNVGDADPGLIDLTRAAIDGLIEPTGAHAILTILINTFRAVQGR